MTFSADSLNPTSARTVGDAQSELDAISDELRPDIARALQAEVDRAKANATQFVDGLAEVHHLELSAMREECLQNVCAVRDDFAALEADIRTGKVTASEARTRWSQLHHQAGSFRAGVLADAESRTALVTEMEDDPVAYADGVFRRMPNLTPKFSF